MNFISDQYILLAAERIKHKRAYTIEEYGRVNVYASENPSWFIRLTWWLLLFLSRIMLAWSERLQNYSFVIRRHNTWS